MPSKGLVYAGLGALSLPLLASPVCSPELTPAQPEPAPIVVARKPAVTWLPSPHHDPRRSPDDVSALVIHDTRTPGVREARIIANHFGNPASEASAHFIIGKAGEIVQCVAEERRAWHAGPSRLEGRERVNDFSIGIELVNAQDGIDPFTDAQYESLASLSAYLVSRYQIPPGRIVGHRHVTLHPHLRQDPADNFDWLRFRREMRQQLQAAGALRQAVAKQ